MERVTVLHNTPDLHSSFGISEKRAEELMEELTKDIVSLCDKTNDRSFSMSQAIELSSDRLHHNPNELAWTIYQLGRASVKDNLIDIAGPFLPIVKMLLNELK
jgi:hypothetical protein